MYRKVSGFALFPATLKPAKFRALKSLYSVKNFRSLECTSSWGKNCSSGRGKNSPSGGWQNCPRDRHGSPGGRGQNYPRLQGQIIPSAALFIKKGHYVKII